MATEKVIFAIIIILFFTGVDCKKNIIGPPPSDDVKPGRRDYVWTIDTLDMRPDETFSLMRMWGSSPTDIWLSGEAGNTINALWHYDGIQWKRYPNQNNVNPTALFGFSKSDVWLASKYNSVWHFDGVNWKRVYTFSLPGDSIFIVNNLYGISPNNIFAIGGLGKSGVNGANIALAHYDGSSWKSLSLPNDQGVLISMFYQRDKDRYFIDGTSFNPLNGYFTDFIYSYENNAFKIIYIDSISGPSVLGINSEVYFLIGKKIYEMQNNVLTIWKDFSNTEYRGSMYGRSEKDFFGESKNGILHYNGTDLFEILQTSFSVDAHAIFEKEVFLGAIDYKTGYKSVIHGRLKGD